MFAVVCRWCHSHDNMCLIVMVGLNCLWNDMLTRDDVIVWWYCYATTHKIDEKRDQRLQNQRLRGGNLLYITLMNNYWMIEMKKPPFYI